MSEELLNDSVFDPPSYIAREFARRIGAKEEEAFFIGNGTGKPTGIFNNTGGDIPTAGRTGGGRTNAENKDCYGILNVFLYGSLEVSRYFFPRIDLMKWKDYGIMIWYETLFEIAEGFVYGTYD